MPRRADLRSVLVIGSGPIVIGQACEFDYSGTQACRVLRQEGIRVSLVNSNPATIMTDPEFADATYVEPITPDVLAKVIAIERPDAILATLGGQTALNAAVALHDAGTLADYGVELIGADIEAIRAGEDRKRFKEIVTGLGADVPRSRACRSLPECERAAAQLGYPVVLRPSYTLGGAGSGIAASEPELRRMAAAGLDASPVTEVLLEESVLGWKEFELELMRDRNDNVVVICPIENVDPMGVHTGNSVTVAPAMTLTDREYQQMRDTAIAVLRAVGVDTGGCNIQFAVHPATGRMVVIEMNPRVSRSSALASKATGFPIAKIAARLAIGYTLDEIRNDITGQTLACFEPALDYVVVKVPRFAFEKFPAADPALTTHMKSVGEAMAIGRSFAEALGKALRSLEQPGAAFSWQDLPGDQAALTARCAVPHDGRMATLHQAIRAGASVPDLAAASGIDPWFIDQIAGIEEQAKRIAASQSPNAELIRAGKAAGLSDSQLGQLTGRTEAQVRQLRLDLGVRPVYHTVDTCAAEFAARTPYLYSTYDEETEVPPGGRPKVIILGSGPNRIGQGIEFDYACVHASYALSQAGYETVMVNCNPETVSTDYDTSGRLYFEPLTLEDVLEVVAAEQASGPVAGVIVQLGGQTPLGLARALAAAGVPVAGTPPEAIHLAEDRREFGQVLAAAGLRAPRYGTALSAGQAAEVAGQLGYPVLVRPSYVLGGRGMEIVYDEASLDEYVRRATQAGPEHPVLIDRFLDDAIEIDVDALFDGRELYLGGVMEHIEEAGIHSGDSACALPPITLGREQVDLVRSCTEAIAAGVGVRGLLNVQYALAAGVLYVLEANPRASRTVPFVSKATGVPLAKAAARIMLGATVAGLRADGTLPAAGDGGTLPPDAPVAVKEAVLPFGRFRDAGGEGVDTLLGPEMRSTGEVMGIDEAFGTAYAKSQAAAYGPLPVKGRAFVSVASKDKRSMIFPVKRLADLGFEIWATEGTADVLRRNGVRATIVRKHSDGPGPDGEPTSVQRILAGQVDLIVTTVDGGPPARSRAQSQGVAGSCAGTGRAGTATRSGPPRCGAAFPASLPRPGWPPPCRASRRSSETRWACARCKSTRPGWTSWAWAGRARAGRARRARACRAPGHDAGRGRGRARPGAGARDRADGSPGGCLPRDDDRGARHRRALPARPVRCPGRRRPGYLDAAAPGVLHPRCAAGPRRHGRVRVLRRRAWHPVAGRPAGQGRAGRHRAARAAVPGAQGSGQLPAGRRRLRQRPAVLAGRAAARAALLGGLPARRGQRGPGVRRAHRPPDRPLGHHHHRGRLAGRPRPGHRHARAGDPRGADRRDLRLRPDADAAPGDRAGGPVRHPGAGRRGGGDGLRLRGLHDLRAAGGGQRRDHPDGPFLRGRPGVPR